MFHRGELLARVWLTEYDEARLLRQDLHDGVEEISAALQRECKALSRLRVEAERERRAAKEEGRTKVLAAETENAALLQSLAAYDRQFTSLLWTVRKFCRGNVSFHEELALLVESHSDLGAGRIGNGDGGGSGGSFGGGSSDRDQEESSAQAPTPSSIMAELDRVSRERKCQKREAELEDNGTGRGEGKENTSVEHLFRSGAINKLGSREQQALESLCSSEEGVLGRVSAYIKKLKEGKRVVGLCSFFYSHHDALAPPYSPTVLDAL